MQRILVLLGSCLFFVGCDITIEGESSKTFEFTLDEDTQVEEEGILDFLFEEKPLDLSNDIDGEDLNRLQEYLKELEQPFAFGPMKVVISPGEGIEHVYFVIENPSEEGLGFRLFNDCGDANLQVLFEARPWLAGSEEAFSWLQISSGSLSRNPNYDNVTGSFDCTLKVMSCVGARSRNCTDFAEQSYTVVVE